MSSNPHVPLVVLGNPENRRVSLFCQAAQRLGWPAPQVVPYSELLSIGNNPPIDVQIPAGSLIRIESPGENAEVEAGLIRLGAAEEGISPEVAAEAARAASEYGRIAAPRLWFLGYQRLLANVERELAPCGVQWMNHPGDIATLFDKTACQRILASHGVPTPPPLSSAEAMPRSYDALRRQMADVGWRRIFVKLRYGSSASGVVALECSRGRCQATTSVEVVRGDGGVKLFNSLRVRQYHDEREIAAMIDELAGHELHVERWLPKAGFQGRVCDLRIVIVAGQVRHKVLRSSRGPITNLHLNNQRGDVNAFLRSVLPEHIDAAWASCRSVAAAFPRHLYLGIDVSFLPSLARHAVIEVNAFGDLLPGLLDDGTDTYGAELMSLRELAGAAGP